MAQIESNSGIQPMRAARMISVISIMDRLFNRSTMLPDHIFVNTVAIGPTIHNPATAAGEFVLCNTITFKAMRYIKSPKREIPVPDNNNNLFFMSGWTFLSLFLSCRK